MKKENIVGQVTKEIKWKLQNPVKMGLFGKSKPADPKALVNEWTKKIRKEGYGLDRQIRQIQRQAKIFLIEISIFHR